MPWSGNTAKLLTIEKLRRRHVMAIRESERLDGSLRPPAQRATQTEPAPGAIITTGAAKFLAVFRVVLGFAFLWAFLDKTFGFGYATPSAKAWINGGSPTKASSVASRSVPSSRPSTPGPGPPGPTGCS
jgi:thiosulfate dehydrogenase [quinone] large subunit